MSAAKRPQATRILDAFSAWLSAAPGRSVRLSYSAEDGWTSTLVETEERPAGGATLADAAAQSAQTVIAEMATGGA